MTDLCPTLLLIEDELSIRRVLCVTLHANGYQVITAATAQEGCTQAAMCHPALMLLDLGLPDLDGLEVTRRLREWATMPIIVLSARGRESDKIAALDAGADDYLTKPFGMGELLARIRVALRHVAYATQETDTPVLYRRATPG
jgi:two-component system KDP operon response regulator KdpE